MKTIKNSNWAFLLCLFITNLGISQEYFETSILGDTFIEVSYHSTTDGDGNLFSTGLYSGTITVGSESVTWAGGNADGFLTKYDINGNPIWVKGFGGGFDDVAIDVATDNNNNIYLTGYFQGAGTLAFDADPGPDVFLLEQPAPILSRDCFIIKLDSNGDFIWAKQISNPSGAGANEDSKAIEVDSNGNVYIAGSFLYADFDPSSSGSVEIFASNGFANNDGFLLKLDTDGNYIWVKTLECLEYASINDIELDENEDIFLTGRFEETIDLDPSSTGVANFVSNGDYDIFVMKLTNDGDYVWGKTFGGPGLDISNVIRKLSSGVYLGGMFSGEVDLDPSPNTNTIIANGDWDAFLSKFDENGNYIFSYTLGGEGNVDLENVYDITQYTEGNLLASGSFIGTADFDNGADEALTTTNGLSDNYILKLTTDGEYQEHVTVGGISTETNAQVVFNANNQIMSLGAFKDAVDFNPFAGTDIISSTGNYDVYFSRLELEEILDITEGNTTSVFLYPNPVNDIISIKNSEILNSFKLYSSTGQLVLSGDIDNNAIDVSKISQGVYMISLYGNNSVITKKIIKQ